MQLELGTFREALLRLDEAWIVLQEDSENSIVRDAVIQRFEFTYELAWKMLRRHLEMVHANPALFEGMSFQNLIRMGADQGLLKSGWDVWWDYRNARAATSHTYDEAKAKEVIFLIPAFIAEVQHLLLMLETCGATR